MVKTTWTIVWWKNCVNIILPSGINTRYIILLIYREPIQRVNAYNVSTTKVWKRPALKYSPSRHKAALKQCCFMTVDHLQLKWIYRTCTAQWEIFLVPLFSGFENLSIKTNKPLFTAFASPYNKSMCPHMISYSVTDRSSGRYYGWHPHNVSTVTAAEMSLVGNTKQISSHFLIT